MIERVTRNVPFNNEEEFIDTLYNNPTFRQVSKVCEMYGYYFPDDEFFLTNGIMNVTLTANDRNSYLPDIYVKFRKGQLEKLATQTYSYGSLETESYEKFMDAVKTAYEFMNYLGRINYSTLPLIKMSVDGDIDIVKLL